MQDKNNLSLSAKRRKGFTLAELLVVVAIIAVLVGVAIPVFSAQTEKARNATDAYNAKVIASTVQTYLLLNSDKMEEFVKTYSVRPSDNPYRPYVLVTDKLIMVSSDPTGIIQTALAEAGLLGKPTGTTPGRFSGTRCQTKDSWKAYTVGFTVIDGQLLVGYCGRASDQRAVSSRWTVWSGPDSTPFRSMCGVS